MKGRAVLPLAAAVSLSAVACSGVNTNPVQTGPGGPLTVTKVVPSSGPLAGNIPIAIQGTNFSTVGLSVSFGAVAMTNPTVVNPQTIQGTLPPSSVAGPVTVTVATQNASASLPNGFTYGSVAGGVTISSITPTSGPTAGGTVVSLAGAGFSGGATSVSFGAAHGTAVQVASDTSLSVTTPPGSAGSVTVAVTNSNGTASLPNGFSYSGLTGGTSLLTNPGFENGMTGWATSTVGPPTAATDKSHSGSASLKLGSDQASGTDAYSGTSWADQAVTIPSSAAHATLDFWYYGITTDTVANDWQEATILNTSFSVLSTVFHQATSTSGWVEKTFDLTPYRGQKVYIHFDVHEDGAGNPTTLWIDDVSVTAQ